jgi:hypothetical protein
LDVGDGRQGSEFHEITSNVASALLYRQRMDLLTVLDRPPLKQPPTCAPVPSPYWPETFVQWVQVAGTSVTAGALILAGIGLWLNGRWRHKDYASERQNHASHLTIVAERAPAGPGASSATIAGAKLFNSGKEIIKEPTIQFIDGETKKPVALLRAGRLTYELLLSHLGPGDEKYWTFTTDAVATFEVDGELRLNINLQVSWIDAAGWRWRMVNNTEPKRVRASRWSSLCRILGRSAASSPNADLSGHRP